MEAEAQSGPEIKMEREVESGRPPARARAAAGRMRANVATTGACCNERLRKRAAWHTVLPRAATQTLQPPVLRPILLARLQTYPGEPRGRLCTGCLTVPPNVVASKSARQ